VYFRAKVQLMNEYSNHTDEIDLRVILNSIKHFFVGIGTLLNNLFLLCKKRKTLIGSFCILGIALGLLLYFQSKPVYIASTTLSSATLRNDFCADLVQDLQSIVRDNTPERLAEKLKINVSSARQIKKIEFSNYDEKLQERFKDKDTVVLGLPFKINVSAYSNTVFDTIQTAIVQYLENNEYALKRKEIRKIEIQLMRNKLSREIHDLDSIKNIVTNNMLPRGVNSGFVFGQPIDPVNIYREGIKLFRDDLDLNKELILIDNIEVISGFSPRDKPDFPVRWKTTFAGAVIGLLFGIFIAIILERKKAI
jgi:hypothetical protein